jgi:hypothetical protein
MRIIFSLAFIAALAVNSASALTVTLVAMSGPRAYHGGVPSFANGSVGFNTSFGGLPPASGGAGVAIFGPSATARMGIVIRLLSSTDGVYQNPDTPGGSNQLSSAFIFLNQHTLGAPGAIDLAGVGFDARNDRGDEWWRFGYTTGMVEWIATRVGGTGGFTNPAYPAPLIEDFHVIASDDTMGCLFANACGGNSFEGRSLFTLQTLVVHGTTHTAEARVLLDFANTEFYTDTGKAYGFRNLTPTTQAVHGGDAAAPGGFWYAANGRTKADAFPIQVWIPEPGSLAILAAGGVWLIRTRRPHPAARGR